MPKGAQAARTAAELKAMHDQKLRCLDAFRQTEVDAWDLADMVSADVIERNEAACRKSGLLRNTESTGINEVIDSIRDYLAREGIERSAGYLKQLYETADSWEPDQRLPTEQASFTAHLALRGVKYPHRADHLRVIVAKAGGHADKRHVQRWIFDRQPHKPPKSRETKAVDSLRAWIKLRLGTKPSKLATADMIELLRTEATRLEATG